MISGEYTAVPYEQKSNKNFQEKIRQFTHTTCQNNE